jgi:hypothetical protein
VRSDFVINKGYPSVDPKGHPEEIQRCERVKSAVKSYRWEDRLPSALAVCLGLQVSSKVTSATMDRIVATRRKRVFDSAARAEIKRLAAADAPMILPSHRRQQRRMLRARG